MALENLEAFREDWQTIESALPLVMGGVSVAILMWCAVTGWLCRSKKDDCLFRRHVM